MGLTKKRAALTPVCGTVVSRLGCATSTLITTGLAGLLQDARLNLLWPEPHQGLGHRTPLQFLARLQRGRRQAEPIWHPTT